MLQTAELIHDVVDFEEISGLLSGLFPKDIFSSKNVIEI
jgi:hypothetical protein